MDDLELRLTTDASYVEELIVPGHGPGILTASPESSGSIQCPQYSLLQPTRSSPGLPVSSQIHPHGTQLVCPAMSAHHIQRNTVVGKGPVNRWQSRVKNTPRQQPKNNLHTTSIASSQTGNGYQIQQANGPFPLSFNAHRGSGSQQLVLLEPQPTTIQSSTSQSILLSPRSNFSSHQPNLSPSAQFQTQGPPPQSTAHSLYPVLQIKPCVERHQNSTGPHTICILEGIPLNHSTTPLTVPCIVSATQAKTNTPKSYYNFSSSNMQSVAFTDKSQPQAHQFRYQQQYTAARFQQISPQAKPQQMTYQTVPKQSRLVVFRPPPREKNKNPDPRAQISENACSNSQLSKSNIPLNTLQPETDKFSYSISKTRYNNVDNTNYVTDSTRIQPELNEDDNITNTQTVQQNSSVLITPGVSGDIPKGLDVITSIQSTWLATQPLGNVHLVMGLSAGNALKKNDSNQSEESLPNPIGRPTVADASPQDTENTQPSASEGFASQNLHLHSDSSTSFEFSIEAEKMVSALCNSTPLKDLENNEQNVAENYEISQNEDSQLHVRRNSEGSVLSLEKLRKPKKVNATSIQPTQDVKHWTSTVAAESSDDAVSIHSISTSDFYNNAEMTGRVVERNPNVSPLKLSPSSNSSNSTVKNESKRIGKTSFQEKLSDRNRVSEQSRIRVKETLSSKRKVKNVCCQTDNFEGVCDEQLMFREITVKGCYEIGKIIEEYMSPSLEGLNQFCVELQRTFSKPEDLLVTESVQKDLMIGFLRLANCWANLYPCLGVPEYKLNSPETVRIEVTELYQNWTRASRKLMEGLIKVFENQIDEIVHENSRNKNRANMSQVDSNESIRFNNEGFVGHNNYAFTVAQGGYSNCHSTTTLTDMYGITTPVGNDNFVLTPQNVISGYPMSPSYDIEGHVINTGNTPMQENHKPNWRFRRLADFHTENTGSRNQAGLRKNKGSFQLPKENCRRWNVTSSGSAASFHSMYTNPKYSETPRGNCRKPDDSGNSPSRTSRSESQVNDRFNRHNMGNRFKHRTNTTSRKPSPMSLNVEAHLREKALENLDFSQHWQQQQLETLESSQKSLNHDIYVGETSIGNLPTVPKNKMATLSEIEQHTQNHVSSEQVDLSSWFQNLGGSLPVSADTSEELYSDRRSHSGTTMDPSTCSNQNASVLPTGVASQQSMRRHSYQDSRYQLIAGKGKSWSNKRNNNYITKPTTTTTTSHTNILISHQYDEHDSSDDLQDRVYMKPGSYDVPKRRPSSVNSRNSTLIINSNASTPIRSLSPAGVIVPFPAAPIVPPPRPMSPKIFRHLLISKPHDCTTSSTTRNNASSNTSDLAWKAACASAETLLETLQGSNHSQKFTNKGVTEIKESKVTEENRIENRNSKTGGGSGKSQNDIDEKNKEDCSTQSTPTSERRKFSSIKTDDWLISTLNNVPKSQGDTESKCHSTIKDEQSLTPIESSSTTNPENQKENEADSQKIPVSKYTNSKRKQDGKKEEEQQTLRSRKSITGTSGRKTHSQNQESGRSNSDSRKRKLQERSPNEEQSQTKNDDFVIGSNYEKGHTAAPTTSSKNKSDIRNKATWNVWYSSRRRRGLSVLAVNKLEDILNVVWNMDASDFIKYPVNSTEIDDYYKHVKHPMFLETIGYKLKNRIYETIEQFVHDFRRIFANAKLYNKDDPVHLKLTSILEIKFNSLLEEHFSGWEFGHITGDPNETTNYPALKYLAFSEKSTSSKNRRAKSSGKSSTFATSNPCPKSVTKSSYQQSST